MVLYTTPVQCTYFRLSAVCTYLLTPATRHSLDPVMHRIVYSREGAWRSHIALLQRSLQVANNRVIGSVK